MCYSASYLKSSDLLSGFESMNSVRIIKQPSKGLKECIDCICTPFNNAI